MNIHFDWLAPVYDRVIPAPKIPRWRELLDMPENGILLDAGGGTGRVSAELKHDVGKIVLCDWSKPMLKEAHAKNGLLLVNGIAERIPFAKNTFDRIMVVDALHHFPHQHQAIISLARILKPGGRLIIEEPDIRKRTTKMIALMEKITLMGSHFNSPDEIAAMMQSAGLNTTIEPGESISTWIIGEKPLSARQSNQR